MSVSYGNGRGTVWGERNGVRGGDDDFGINELLVELRALALLVGGCDKSVSLVLEPFSDSQLVLSCAL